MLAVFAQNPQMYTLGMDCLVMFKQLPWSHISHDPLQPSKLAFLYRRVYGLNM